MMQTDPPASPPVQPALYPPVGARAILIASALYHLAAGAFALATLSGPARTWTVAAALGCAGIAAALRLALPGAPRADVRQAAYAVVLVSALIFNLTYLSTTGAPEALVLFLLWLILAGALLTSTLWLLGYALAAALLSLAMLPWPLATLPSPYMLATALTLVAAYGLHRITRAQALRGQAQERWSLALTESAAGQHAWAESLATIARAAHTQPDAQRFAQDVADHLRAAYDCSHVGILLTLPGSEDLILRATAVSPGHALIQPGTRVRSGSGVIGWAALHRQSLCLEDVSRDPRFVRWDLVPETRSEVAVPLTFGEHLLGVLDLQSARVSGLRRQDLPLYESLARQIALGLRALESGAASQQYRQMADTLHSIARTLAGSSSSEIALHLILHQLPKVVPHDRGAILMQDGAELRMVAVRGFPEGRTAMQWRVPIRPGDVFDEVRARQHPLVLEDALQRRDWHHMQDLLPARSWMGVPLMRGDTVVGMLSLARVTHQPYSEEEVAFAETFAGQAMVALEAARRREETPALPAAANGQASRIERTKSNFIAIASHELRTPLTALRGYAQLLRAQLASSPVGADPTRMETLAGIESGAQRLQEIVDGMLDIVRIDSGSLDVKLSQVALHGLITMVIAKLKEGLDGRELTIRAQGLERLPPIESDARLLEKAFQQLLANAVKYTPDGGQITVSGKQASPTTVELIVKDTGIGIEPELLELIFSRFYRADGIEHHSSGKTKFKGAGPGLGLAIVQGLVETLGGQIWAVSAGRDEVALPGSEFHVILPLRQR